MLGIVLTGNNTIKILSLKFFGLMKKLTNCANHLTGALRNKKKVEQSSIAIEQNTKLKLFWSLPIYIYIKTHTGRADTLTFGPLRKKLTNCTDHCCQRGENLDSSRPRAHGVTFRLTKNPKQGNFN